ncbi:protein ALWAYS EARLY 3 isoform X1 [Quercus lobata]|nr:protein ALWAYS EARLY 3 isoform X1 [Quercus lobata]XP_030974091.1 protein ALWAYS EARLY 3 isoform X1 [Quercus lobata]
MAPSRKSRSVNKRFSYINEVASSKDGENANKSRQRGSPGFVQKKRKLSDMLGAQWSKEELERFYAAYRKFGKDWKKVAAAVRNRSTDMVEALYSMNKAYLSLPEGTASVVGLIAMMTDHYCVLGGSDSEQESNEGAEVSRKPQKRARVKTQNNTSKGLDGNFPDVSRSQSVASSYGCLSLLKKRRSGIKPHAVGKRTPRVPVSYYDKDNAEKYFSPARQGSKQKVDSKDDDVAHEIALVLTEASQRGGSPQLSRTPNRKAKGARPSPVKNGERMHAESETTCTKLRGSQVDEGGCELSLGSTEADNGDYARDKGFLRGRERAGTVGQQKVKRYHVKKPEVEESINNDVDDIKEACSGTEEGQKPGAVKGKLESEVVRSPFKGPRKRSKKVLFGGDDGSEFDALQTLANLSLMMPDTESSAQVKEESLDKSKLKGNHSIPEAEVSALRTSKLSKGFTHNIGAIPETKEEAHPSNTGIRKRKQKTSPFKLQIFEKEAHTNSHSEPKKIEATAEVVSVNKGRRSSHNSAQAKQGRVVKPKERTPLSTDLRGEGNDSALPTVQVTSADQVNLPTKARSRRKVDLQKPVIQNDSKSSENILNDHPSIQILSSHDRVLSLKEKLSNCLSSDQARRWCTFEWFYSAIDYPWFAKREFMEYLDHVGLGLVPRLTRVEWGVIRSSLGRPRRFSQQFLKEEREKLNQYRESVRGHYAELRAGTREGLPTDLARPLSVGQRVIALHPRTREIHNGSVLTVDHCRCRIQFDQPELGVEFVLDIDCMPFNPLENMPASLTRHNASVNKLFENFNELKIKFAPSENLESTDGPYISPSSHHISNLLKQGGSPSSSLQAKVRPTDIANTQQAANSQPSLLAQIQAKEADVQALSELTLTLDKKEAVLAELRCMNDAVFDNQKDGDNSLKESESFKKQYAAVLLQLNEVNEQVSSALFCLRQRNTYQESSPHLLLKSMANLGDPGGQLSSLDCSAGHAQESGSHVSEIVESSRKRAKTMVDVAMQAVSSFKKGGVNMERIEEAMDFVNNQLSVDDSSMLVGRASAPADANHVTLASQDQSTACSSVSSATNNAPDPNLDRLANQNEVKIPSELIVHCVATLLMIQKCTERQFPPAVVAQVLDSAVKSLQPCCSQNLPIYAEIQKCMGIIRNQILALVPTT